MIEGRKQAVSIRMNAADVKKVKRLASRLGARLRFWRSDEPGSAGWLGPTALALVILSWWNNQSVPQVVAWLVGCLRTLVR